MRMTQAEYLAYEARMMNRKLTADVEYIPVEKEIPLHDETCERDLHSKIKEECRARGWICLTGSMAHRAMRTIGEWDFTIVADRGRVFFVEAKSKTGKLSPEQAALQAWAKKLDHEIHVLRSFEQFLQLTKI